MIFFFFSDFLCAGDCAAASAVSRAVCSLCRASSSRSALSRPSWHRQNARGQGRKERNQHKEKLSFIQQALANSCESNGKKVSFFYRKGADVLSKWVGEAGNQSDLALLDVMETVFVAHCVFAFFLFFCFVWL